jgi:hypothetical protein
VRAAEAATRPGAADDPLHDRPARRERGGDQRDPEVRARPLRRFGAWPAVQFATPLPGTRGWPGDRLPAGRTATTATGDRASSGRQRSAASCPSGAGSSCGPSSSGWRPRGPAEADHERDLRVQQPLHVLRRGHAHADRRPPDPPARAAAQYRRLGVPMVDFDGGEPTLNPELVPLIRHARALGYAASTSRPTAAAAPTRSSPRSSSLRPDDPAVQHPRPRRAARTRRTWASPRPSSRPIAGVRQLRAPRAAGVELGHEHHDHEGQHELLASSRSWPGDLGLPWMNVQFLTPFGRATSPIAPDTQAAAIAAAVIDAFRRPDEVPGHQPARSASCPATSATCRATSASSSGTWRS